MLIWIIFQPTLFRPAARLCYGIQNRISQLSAHFKMSVGGGGLVAYRLDQLVMFIHVCINAVCDSIIMNLLPVFSVRLKFYHFIC